MLKYYCINGELTPSEEASLHVSDLSILRGYGLFDFFTVRKGKPLFLEDYLDRFYQSAWFMRLDVPFSREDLTGQILELVEANGLEEAGIRLVLTGGYAPDGYTPTAPNLLIMEYPAPKYPASHYENGVKLMLFEYNRTFPTAKTINYIVGINLLPQMRAVGAEDVLFFSDGHIFETTRANFFIVTQDDVIVTPGEGILKGVTRKKTLEVARRHFKVEERPLAMEELATAKEAFMTSSTKRVLPVTQVDETVIGSGKPGVVTQELLRLFLEEEERWLSAARVG